jgi:hypothetical protein
VTLRILRVPNYKRVTRDRNESQGLEGADPPATIQGGESIVVATDFINTRDSVADGWDTAMGQKDHIGSYLEVSRVTEQPSPQAAEIENADIA